MTTNYSTQSTPHPPKQSAIRLPAKALNEYIAQRLQDQKQLPVRLHILFDDLSILLRQHKKIDVFDLLVQLILHADDDPALCLCDLMSVLDEDALFNLEPRTIAHTGEFLRDVMKHKAVRWQLEHYHEEYKAMKKQPSQD